MGNSVRYFVAAVALTATIPSTAFAQPRKHEGKGHAVQLGPRPFFLVDDMDEGPLKDALQECSAGPFFQTDFSIGHRGAALQFPEHTEQSYRAAAREGAGILECDVAVTQDGELVCRHDQCDLHSTTDILTRPELVARCGTDSSGTPLCCTSQFTLAEIKGLCGKMDGLTPPSWRTDLYASCGTIMSHKETIELFSQLQAKFTPELKEVKFLPAGVTYDSIRQKLIDEYKQANIDPKHVWPQSFFIEDVLYWIQHEPEFGRQAVFLDSLVDTNYAEAKQLSRMQAFYDQGVRIIAPPMFALLEVKNGKIVPSEYARNAKTAKLEIITWTLERSGRLADLAPDSYYYQTITGVVNNDGDMMNVLDVLAREVRILGIFSDWPSTVTYYANCVGLK
jgi:glycerophosphoryl diester phosphodiesterase